jgi:hypothetical protein
VIDEVILVVEVVDDEANEVGVTVVVCAVEVVVEVVVELVVGLLERCIVLLAVLAIPAPVVVFVDAESI